MATATTPQFTREVVRTWEVDGERRTTYRTTFPPDYGTEPSVVTTVDRLEPFPAEILRDRWDVLMAPDGDYGKWQLRLDRILTDLSERVSRRSSAEGPEVTFDGGPADVSVVFDVSGLEEVIRDWILERAARVAR